MSFQYVSVLPALSLAAGASPPLPLLPEEPPHAANTGDTTPIIAPLANNLRLVCPITMTFSCRACIAPL
jgi:hypothetical protein